MSDNETILSCVAIVCGAVVICVFIWRGLGPDQIGVSAPGCGHAAVHWDEDASEEALRKP